MITIKPIYVRCEKFFLKHAYFISAFITKANVSRRIEAIWLQTQYKFIRQNSKSFVPCLCHALFEKNLFYVIEKTTIFLRSDSLTVCVNSGTKECLRSDAL